MTIDDAITIFHGLECNPLFSEKHFKAFDMAIASLEAWKEFKQEIMEYCKKGVMDGDIISTELCAIIDKHLQEVVSPTGAESEDKE